MNRNLKFLLVSSSMAITAGNLLGPIYAVYVENIGGDLLTAGGAYGIYAIFAGVLTMVMGKWEDMMRHQEKMIVLGYVLNCFGTFGYLVIRNPIDLFIVQIVIGISEAVRTPAYDGLYSKFLDRGKFASEWGVWESMSYIVTAIAATGGSLIATFWGFHALFFVMLAFSIFGTVLSTGLFLTDDMMFRLRYSLRKSVLFREDMTFRLRNSLRKAINI